VYDDESAAEAWEDCGADFEEISAFWFKGAVKAEVLHVEHQHELGVAAGDAAWLSVGEVPEFFAVGETACGAALAPVVDYADGAGDCQRHAVVEVGAQDVGGIDAGRVDDDEGGFVLAGAFKPRNDDALGLCHRSAKEAGEATRYRHGWADGEGFGSGNKFAHRGAKIRMREGC